MTSIYSNEFSSQMDGVRPSSAVVFFEDDNEKKTVFATVHKVKNDNTLSVGRIASASALQKHFMQLSVIGSPVSLIPSFGLAQTAKGILWWRARHVSRMWFNTGKKVVSLNVEWPNLLYMALHNGGMRVFGLGNASRPDETSTIYHAPLMNIDSKGLVCLGSATVPKIASFENVGNFEEAITGSRFTHVNHKFTLRNGATNKGLLKYWKAKSSEVHPCRVKTSELKPCGKLSEVLRTLA